MGWTSYQATHFYNGGQINRKKECDSYFLDGLNAGWYEIKHSVMRGATYYAAITPQKRYVKTSSGESVEDIPAPEQKTFGVVVLTRTGHNKEFWYKLISEDMGPAESQCPNSVLRLLDKTDDAYALAWRARCEKNNAHPQLNKLPVGTIISFDSYDKKSYDKKSYDKKEKIRLIKRAPAYQFKTTWWECMDHNAYYAKKRIPKDFVVEQ